MRVVMIVRLSLFHALFSFHNLLGVREDRGVRTPTSGPLANTAAERAHPLLALAIETVKE